MNIFVPFTDLQPITKYCLKDYTYSEVPITEEDSYWRYFKSQWNKGESFINVEQDVVFWPGALESLWNCAHYWCIFGYGLLGTLNHPRQWPPLGLVKFDKNFIDQTSSLWDEVDHNWRNLDGNLAEWVIDHDMIGYHQHYPGVVNYHPNLI